MSQSSVSIGEEPGFDLAGPLVIRECTEDIEYPLSLEGETKGGHSVAVSLTNDDTYNLLLKLKEIYGI